MLTRASPRGKTTLLGKSASLAGAPKVLLTGFDAFGGESLNPSWLAVQALHGTRVLGRRMVAAQLPTVFGTALGELRQLLEKHRPELVICVGQACGRAALSLERVAINVNDARIADNTGEQPVDTPVVAQGPAAYFSTLPIKAMLRDLQAAGITAEVSQTAGTFVCNHVFYGLMHFLATSRGLRGTRGGFIHVPFLPEQAYNANTPSMPLSDIVQGIKLGIRSALKNPIDLALGAGAIH